MKRLANLKKRSGFTLVELLIVIIIIGILAGAMLLVAGSGTDSAEATKIISDLRSLKSAALLYYADHPTETTAPGLTDLENYMDRKLDANLFDVDAGTASADTWWVGRKEITTGPAGKLAARATAEDIGVYGAIEGTTFIATDEEAWMRAR